MPEAPKKIQEDRTVRPVDISRNNQGCFAFEGGDYDKAINQFEQAIKADSQFAVAHYNLGCAYLETKTYKKAVDAFDETVVLDQNFKEAYYNLGIAWFRMNIFQSAKQAVEKALSIDPNYQLAQELLTDGNRKRPAIVNQVSPHLPSKRFSETQNMPVMVLEFKGSETVAGVCEGFVERQSTGLILSKQRVGH